MGGIRLCVTSRCHDESQYLNTLRRIQQKVYGHGYVASECSHSLVAQNTFVRRKTRASDLPLTRSSVGNISCSEPIGHSGTLNQEVLPMQQRLVKYLTEDRVFGAQILLSAYFFMSAVRGGAGGGACSCEFP